MNWKFLAIGLLGLLGIGGTVGVTVLVMKHHQDTAMADAQALPVQQASMAQPVPQAMMQQQPAAAPQVDPAAARMREIKAECREYAQRQVKKQTGEVLKDSAIGALIGAGTGAAGGAIADGGSGAGKGAAIGSVAGVVGGTIYGLNANSKEAIYRRAYTSCMKSKE